MVALSRANIYVQLGINVAARHIGGRSLSGQKMQFLCKSAQLCVCFTYTTRMIQMRINKCALFWVQCRLMHILIHLVCSNAQHCRSTLSKRIHCTLYISDIILRKPKVHKTVMTRVNIIIRTRTSPRSTRPN